jgi:hypothetical protein
LNSDQSAVIRRNSKPRELLVRRPHAEFGDWSSSQKGPEKAGREGAFSCVKFDGKNACNYHGPLAPEGQSRALGRHGRSGSGSHASKRHQAPYLGWGHQSPNLGSEPRAGNTATAGRVVSVAQQVVAPWRCAPVDSPCKQRSPISEQTHTLNLRARKLAGETLASIDQILMSPQKRAALQAAS